MNEPEEGPREAWPHGTLQVILRTSPLPVGKVRSHHHVPMGARLALPDFNGPFTPGGARGPEEKRGGRGGAGDQSWLLNTV